MAEYEKPEKLNLNGNVESNFELFRQEVDIYFTANETYKKSKEIQVARLLNIMGAEARKIYFQIKDSIEEQTVSAILDALKSRCIPKRNLVMSQFKFFQRKQVTAEPFDKFYTDLKELVKNCEFKDAENQLMCTQIVLGIQNKETQQKLLENNMDLEKTVQFCQSIELSEKSRQEIETTTVTANGNMSVYRVKSNYQWQQNNGKGKQFSRNNRDYVNFNSNINYKNKSNVKYLCKKCNREHGPKNCPAYGKKCNKCSKINHFSVGCKNKKGNVRVMDLIETENLDKVQEMSSEEEYLTVNSINKDRVKNKIDDKKWLQVIKINNLNVEVRLDTGAEVSILPYNMYNKLNPKPIINKCNIKIETFGGFLIKPLGTVWVECQIKNGKTVKGNFIVVNDIIIHDEREKKIETILGSEMCEKLELVKRITLINKENKFMEKNKDVFSGLGLFPEKFIYFDDILISANTKEEHDAILEQVIQVARENNIKFNKEKIQYEMNEVKFLGFLFNESGMRPDPSRVEAINDLKDPTNKTELQKILGMINYLRDFIPNMSQITSALRELLKKDRIWCWNEKHSDVLKEVKRLMCNAVTLVNFDPNEKIEIQCDASQDAIGSCLLQNKKPVCFLSRSLTETEKGNFKDIDIT
ncbi:uncharacterized protein LOC126845447 [Adelges cooleyi]|uniref:uncharacterized protein LOC126845447 n=1 Tax=Adelges cooleyi TaxID=133065 RepID=UPI00217F55F2|nr:uncharacterized protein LOC126845447 [Adelges cooleyi]